MPETIPDCRAIRARLGLSQAAFAARFGLSYDAVRAWEGGRQRPRGSAATLLRLIERDPEEVARLLVEARRPYERLIAAVSGGTSNPL